MTFQEFFKKKKINLELLKAAEPALFAEFELHYGQMGEKSFDHTKKYWFNTLRSKYHAPDEPKVEKVHLENKLAEQTVIESITDQSQTAPAPKLGFKPKFKTASTTPESELPAIEEKAEPATHTETIAPKLGFKPKFKTAATPSETTTPDTEEKAEPVNNAETAAPKLGFKPKFKSVAATPVEDKETNTSEEKAEPVNNSAETPVPKLGFKPKFRSTATPEPGPAESAAPPAKNIESPISAATPPPKLGFKPKFRSASPSASPQLPSAGTPDPMPPDADTPSE